MKREILVPLDGSALAETVLPHAVAMAKLTHSALLLVQAVPEPGLIDPAVASVASPVDTYDVWVDDLNDARAYMARVVERPEFEGLDVRTSIEQDYPAAAILHNMETNAGIFMVAMSTHGRSGLGRWMFGSVAEKVIHASTKPVLIVRPTQGTQAGVPEGEAIEPELMYKHILVPLDGSHFAEEGLDWAKGFANTTHSVLQLVSVVSGNTRAAKTEEGVGPRWTEAALAAGVDSMTHYLTGTRQRLRDEGFEAHTLVMRGNAAEMLLSAGESTHSDLIVMSTHGRSGWQRLWMGSVAMKVVQGACCPVLLVRPRQAQG